MAMKFWVRTVPTVILMENVAEVKSVMGFKMEELNEMTSEL